MAKNTETKKTLVIPPPNFKVLITTIVGDSIFVQNRFSKKAADMMREKMEAGSTTKKGAKRSARDFKSDFEESYYRSSEGWYGIPAGTIRNGMISACKIVGFQMTRAKLSVFVLADGNDALDGSPIIKISKTPVMRVDHVRNATGVCDLRARAEYGVGWEADLRIRYDADQFTETDILNLLMRCGIQVGIGNGRPDSRMSNGLGWGTFEIKSEATATKGRRKAIAAVAS